jgi:predicted RNase H-like nuclease (RuvC/YqgF family)
MKKAHGLMKIPSEEVISELRMELGKAVDMISELEYKIAELHKVIKIFSRWNKNLVSDDISNKRQIDTLQEEVKRQQKANMKLKRSIHKLKNIRS